MVVRSNCSAEKLMEVRIAKNDTRGFIMCAAHAAWKPALLPGEHVYPSVSQVADGHGGLVLVAIADIPKGTVLVLSRGVVLTAGAGATGEVYSGDLLRAVARGLAEEGGGTLFGFAAVSQE